LDWDTTTTTVRDNWVYNAGGRAVKVIWENNNVVNEGNRSSKSPITPPFIDQLGPNGTATNGIDLSSNTLTGSIIHYTDAKHVKTTGKWTPRSANGMWGLFQFNYLVGNSDTPSTATFTLPIEEDGTYEIWLLYTPHKNRASNAAITIAHAKGSSQINWDMREGSKHGFAVKIGSHAFKADGDRTVTFQTADADGFVIVDGVGFVRVAE
ncbi:MAG: hypothetical protein AB8C95_05760, partial [Phycisphaeraceae bacterium]